MKLSLFRIFILFLCASSANNCNHKKIQSSPANVKSSPTGSKASVTLPKISKKVYSPNRKYRFELVFLSPSDMPCVEMYQHYGCEMQVYENQNNKLIFTKKAVIPLYWFDKQSIVFQKKFGDDGNMTDSFTRLWIPNGKMEVVWRYESYNIYSEIPGESPEEPSTTINQFCELLCNSIAYKKKRCYSFVHTSEEWSGEQTSIDMFYGNMCENISRQKGTKAIPTKFLRSFALKGGRYGLEIKTNYEKYKQGIFFKLKDKEYQILENHRVVVSE